MSKTSGPDIPTQYVNLSQLISTLGQTIVASEHPEMSEQGKEKLRDLFDVVLGGLSSYIDREFPGTKRENVLSLVQPEIYVSSSEPQDEQLEIFVSNFQPEEPPVA